MEIVTGKSDNFSPEKAREIRHNNFMGQGESALCNFAECTPMPKGVENPEKEELRYKGQ